MTIASEIQTLQTNLSNSYSAVSAKGGTLPATQSFNNLATAINSISGGSVQPVVEALTVTPSTQKQTIFPQLGVDGFNPVTVNAVTSSIDSNIVPEKIKKDTYILGVRGTYQGEAESVYAKNLTSTVYSSQKVYLINYEYKNYEISSGTPSPVVGSDSKSVYMPQSSTSYSTNIHTYLPQKVCWGSKLEVGLCISSTTTSFGGDIFALGASLGSIGVGITLGSLTIDGNLYFILPNNTQLSTGIGSDNVITNQKYYLKLTIIDTTATVYVSTDNSTWTQTATATYTDARMINSSDNNYLVIGNYGGGPDIEVFTEYCYLSIDDEEIWRAYINCPGYGIISYKKANNLTITGKAEGTIYSNNSGNVKILKQS